MSMADSIAVEFDKTRHVLHLSSIDRIEISQPPQLDGMCAMVSDLLARYGPERLYMIVDITNIVIDPSLSEVYGRKIRKIADKFLHPGGIARYGYQITRITIEMALSSDESLLGNLFSSRLAAELYIDNLILRSKDGATPIPTPPLST